jgi:hypothetical protein
MNTSHTDQRRTRRVLSGVAAIVLAGGVLGTPTSATATQARDSGGSGTSTANLDIADYVDYIEIVKRKVEWAQDRVDG